MSANAAQQMKGYRMLRETSLKVLLALFVNTCVAVSVVSIVFAQKTGASTTTSSMKAQAPVAAKAATSVSAAKPQVIETEVTEDNVFDPEDAEVVSDADQNSEKVPSAF